MTQLSTKDDLSSSPGEQQKFGAEMRQILCSPVQRVATPRGYNHCPRTWEREGMAVAVRQLARSS